MSGKVLENIDLTTKQSKMVKQLLRKHLPNTEVWAYGSRVKFSSRPDSDLDMVAFATPEQATDVMLLKEAFEESDLPFTVDFFVWDEVPDNFHKTIKREHFILQKMNGKVPAQTLPSGDRARPHNPAPRQIMKPAMHTPHGWIPKKVSDIAQINAEAYSPKENWGLVNYFDTSSVTKGVFSDAQSIPGDQLPSRARRKIRDGDIVYSTVRPNQRHYGIIKNPPANTLVSTGFAVVRGKQKVCDTRFLYYALTQGTIVEYLQNIAEQNVSAYPAVLPKDLASLEILLPPLREQRAIAHILGTLDDKIELNRQMSQTLEAMAQALFKSWFIDFDPVHAKAALRTTNANNSPLAGELARQGQSPQTRRWGDITTTLKRARAYLNRMDPKIADLFPDRFEDSELGPIPEGWQVCSLDQIADYMNGLACQKYPAGPEEPGLPVIKIRELRSMSCNQADRSTANVPSKYLVRDGDILFSWSGTLLIKPWVGGDGILNQHLFKVSSSDYPKWFYYFWTLHHMQDFIGIAADKATTMGHIKRHHLSDAKVYIPSEALMHATNTHLKPMLQSAIDKLIENQQLIATRDTLLPRLLSGEITHTDGV